LLCSAQLKGTSASLSPAPSIEGHLIPLGPKQERGVTYFGLWHLNLSTLCAPTKLYSPRPWVIGKTRAQPNRNGLETKALSLLVG